MEIIVDAQPPSRPSPIETVPPEVLRQIFEALALAIEDCAFIHFSVSGRLRCRSSVFALSQTCSLWRNISLTQPSLWSTVSFDAVTTDRLIYSEMIAKNEASLREFLQRSSDVMLHLSVECLDSFCLMVPAVVSVVGVFAEYAHRYRDLVLTFAEHGETNDTWEIFKSTAPPASGRILDIDVDEGCLPRLESLTLKYFDLWRSPYLLQVKPFSHGQCPRLHTLHIASLHSDTVIPGLNNLTTLKVDLYVGSLAILLANHPLLKKLTVHDISVSSPPPLSIPSRSNDSHPVYHTNLKTLIWGGISVHLEYGPRAWDSVYLPNLTDLGVNIHTPLKPGRWYDSEIKAFLGPGGSFQAMKMMLIRSNCTLENVSLYNIPEDVMKEFFSDVPMREGCRNGRTVYDIHNKNDIPNSVGIIVMNDAQYFSSLRSNNHQDICSYKISHSLLRIDTLRNPPNILLLRLQMHAGIVL